VLLKTLVELSLAEERRPSDREAALVAGEIVVIAMPVIVDVVSLWLVCDVHRNSAVTVGRNRLSWMLFFDSRSSTEDVALCSPRTNMFEVIFLDVNSVVDKNLAEDRRAVVDDAIIERISVSLAPLCNVYANTDESFFIETGEILDSEIISLMLSDDIRCSKEEVTIGNARTDVDADSTFEKDAILLKVGLESKVDL